MDPIIMVVMVALAIGLGIWWWLRRRAPEPVEDEWTLPPERGARPAAPPPAQVLDREALLGRDRTLDPSGWDDSPDPEGTPDADVPPAAAAGDAQSGNAVTGEAAHADDLAADDLPKYFDRSYLERRQEPGEA
ncbi:MAG TPA: hypothetical protein PLE12_11295 [Propionicimonas sp.]|nr:hypothetical protein [Propionicimonas sp.]